MEIGLLDLSLQWLTHFSIQIVENGVSFGMVSLCLSFKNKLLNKVKVEFIKKKKI